MDFDIVIPVGPHDVDRILHQLEFTRHNIIGYRNIYLISSAVLDVSGCQYIPESIFPFSLSSVAEIHGASSRNGWYLQQLLKLYAGQIIPGILPRYLIVDADTHFLHPTSFISPEEKPMYAVGEEYHIPYFSHMQKLHPTFRKMHASHSGICHHMVFDTMLLQEMFTMVEEHHSKRAPFWKLFLDCVTPDNYKLSGASEYEIYFNYLLQYHSTDIQVRPLRWRNATRLNVPDDSKKYDFVSCHWYMRH